MYDNVNAKEKNPTASRMISFLFSKWSSWPSGAYVPLEQLLTVIN